MAKEHVYMLQGWDGHIKIGMTRRTPRKRLKDINRDNYAGFSHWSLIKSWPVTNAAHHEKRLHEKFKAYQRKHKGARECFKVPSVANALSEINTLMGGPKTRKATTEPARVRDRKLFESQLERETAALEEAREFFYTLDAVWSDVKQTPIYEDMLAAKTALADFRKNEGAQLARNRDAARRHAVTIGKKADESEKECNSLSTGTLFVGAAATFGALVYTASAGTYEALGALALFAFPLLSFTGSKRVKREAEALRSQHAAAVVLKEEAERAHDEGFKEAIAMNNRARAAYDKLVLSVCEHHGQTREQLNDDTARARYQRAVNTLPAKIETTRAAIDRLSA